MTTEHAHELLFLELKLSTGGDQGAVTDQGGDESFQGVGARNARPGEADLLVGPELLPAHGLQVLYKPPHPLLLRLR